MAGRSNACWRTPLLLISWSSCLCCVTWREGGPWNNGKIISKKSTKLRMPWEEKVIGVFSNACGMKPHSPSRNPTGWRCRRLFQPPFPGNLHLKYSRWQVREENGRWTRLCRYGMLRRERRILNLDAIRFLLPVVHRATDSMGWEVILARI